MFSNIEFFIVEAFRSFKRGALMSLVAVGTITVSLVLFGIFLLLVINLGNVVGDVSSRLDVVAYVDKDISLKEAGALQIELAKLQGVTKVRYISNDESWKEFRKDFGAKLDLNEVVRYNPLPHSFMLTVRTPELLSTVADEVVKNDLVVEASYSDKMVAKIKSLVDAVRIGGAALVILISIATLLIVVNTIRLTVLARETDISIMKLVGATNTFVKFPFIIEGIIIGVIGGVSAFLILKLAYDAVAMRLALAFPFLPIMTDQGLLLVVYVVMIFGGTALGMLGAYISVSKVLKQKF